MSDYTCIEVLDYRDFPLYICTCNICSKDVNNRQLFTLSLHTYVRLLKSPGSTKHLSNSPMFTGIKSLGTMIPGHFL